MQCCKLHALHSCMIDVTLVQLKAMPASCVRLRRPSQPTMHAALRRSPGSSYSWLVLMLRGQVRSASGRESDVAVTRQVQPYQSPVTHRVVAEGNGDKVGMVRLAAFNARTRAEVAAALRDMEAQVGLLHEKSTVYPVLVRVIEFKEDRCSLFQKR